MQWAPCPTRQGPSVTAITICSTSNTTDRAKFTPQYFPGRASLVPYWGTHNSDGEGVLGRRKETFVRLRSSASPGDRALATRGLRACFFSAVGPQEPSAPVGVLTSRHKKELRNTLATAVPRSPIFFGLPGTASSRQRLFCGTGLSPPTAPHPSEVRPFEPWR